MSQGTQEPNNTRPLKKRFLSTSEQEVPRPQQPPQTQALYTHATNTTLRLQPQPHHQRTKMKKKKDAETDAAVNFPDGATSEQEPSMSIRERPHCEPETAHQHEHHKPKIKASKKTKLLQLLPESIKSSFGTIGFCKWGKRHVPARVVSPFQIPKGAARDSWKQMLQQMRQNGESLETMCFLIYWYGEPNPDQCYSLMPQSDFVPYHHATNKMLSYASKAQHKLDQKMTLTSSEKRRIREMAELQLDLEQRQQTTKTVAATTETTQKQPEKEKEEKTEIEEHAKLDNQAHGDVDDKKIACAPPLEQDTPAAASGEPQLKKRPRGRPPLGKVWDPIKGVYVPVDKKDKRAATHKKARKNKASASDENVPDSETAPSLPPPPSPPHETDEDDKQHQPQQQQQHLPQSNGAHPRRNSVRSSTSDKPLPKKRKRDGAGSQKSKKTARNSSTTKQKKAELMQQLLECAKKDARAALEREKEDVMSRLPDSVRDKFGQVGFCKWGKVYLPALVLSPYSVPPGEVRDTWMELFQEMQEEGRSLKKMSLLVFWYGELDPQNFYSLVPIASFCPHEQATEKMLNFAEKAELKRAMQKRLVDDDKHRIRAMQELQEDLARPIHERRRGVLDFEERSELLTMDDLEDVDLDTDDDGFLTSDEEGDGSNVGDGDEDGYSSLDDSEDDLNDDRKCMSVATSSEEDEIENDEEEEDDDESSTAEGSCPMETKAQPIAKKDHPNESAKHASDKTKPAVAPKRDALFDSSDDDDAPVQKQSDPMAGGGKRKTKSLKRRIMEQQLAQSKSCDADDELVDSSDDESHPRRKQPALPPKRIAIKKRPRELAPHCVDDASVGDFHRASEAAGLAPRLGNAAMAITTTATMASMPQPMVPHVAKSADAAIAASVISSHTPDEVVPVAPVSDDAPNVAAIAAAGVNVGGNNKLPVLEVFTQIVKQVCQERDSALQKISTLEALLEEKKRKRRAKDPPADEPLRVPAPTPGASSSSASNENNVDQEDEEDEEGTTDKVPSCLWV